MLTAGVVWGDVLPLPDQKIMEQYCSWNNEDPYLCERKFYNNEGELEQTNCYNVLGELTYSFYHEVPDDICNPSDSPSVEKAEGTLLSRGVPCATLKEVLVHYYPFLGIDWEKPYPTLMNLKSGASFYMILKNRDSCASDYKHLFTKTFHILYRPVYV